MEYIHTHILIFYIIYTHTHVHIYVYTGSVQAAVRAFEDGDAVDVPRTTLHMPACPCFRV